MNILKQMLLMVAAFSCATTRTMNINQINEEFAAMDEAKRKASLFSHTLVASGNLNSKVVLDSEMLQGIDTRLNVLKCRLSEMNKEQERRSIEREEIYKEAELLHDVATNARYIMRTTEKIDRALKAKL
jgi:hypothetical protein